MSNYNNAGQLVSLEEASNWTAAYRESISDDEIIASAFSKDIIMEVLNQTNCVGIRYYYGLDAGKKNLILVGFDKEGNDLIHGPIAQHGMGCPNNCSESNPLNSPQ